MVNETCLKMDKFCFVNREKELGELKIFLHSIPNAILFIYGPKSSGKTTLIRKVMEDLETEPFKFYEINLRKVFVSNYKDFIDLFFELSPPKEKEIEQVRRYNLFKLFQLDVKIREAMESRYIDPFKVMELKLMEDMENNKRPVIVIDELQTIKDLYINEKRRFLDEIMNFFISMTKVDHLAHVLVLCSDTFFIEEIYRSSKLENTSRFYLLDYLDEDRTKEWLKREGFSDEEISMILYYLGGNIWAVYQFISERKVNINMDIKKVLDELYRGFKGKIFYIFYIIDSEEEGFAQEIWKSLRIFSEKDAIPFKSGIMRHDILNFLVDNEILFYDPLACVIRPQSRPHLLAIREFI